MKNQMTLSSGDRQDHSGYNRFSGINDTHIHLSIFSPHWHEHEGSHPSPNPSHQGVDRAYLYACTTMHTRRISHVTQEEGSFPRWSRASNSFVSDPRKRDTRAVVLHKNKTRTKKENRWWEKTNAERREINEETRRGEGERRNIRLVIRTK